MAVVGNSIVETPNVLRGLGPSTSVGGALSAATDEFAASPNVLISEITSLDVSVPRAQSADNETAAAESSQEQLPVSADPNRGQRLDIVA
jgi:hypothetical protein